MELSWTYPISALIVVNCARRK